MANLIAEVTPAEYNFEVFANDSFLWERILKQIDEAGLETEFDLGGYVGTFSVVDESGGLVFEVDHLGDGYPLGDGVTIADDTVGQMVVFKQAIPNVVGVHEYAFRLFQGLTATTLLYGKYNIKEPIAP